MRIAFFCHPTSAGLWSPESLADGVGGSEEAVVHMASQLAGRGHHVSVHFPRLEEARWHGLVEYGCFETLVGDRIDVGIVWRRAARAEQLLAHAIRPRLLYLWLHDNVGREALLEHEHYYDKLMVLSAYHRSRFPELPDDRFFVTANGIDPNAFRAPHPPRDPFLLVYGSDYVRGLRALLRSWGAIKRAEPRARLHVFYGWRGLEAHRPVRAALLQHQFAPLLAQDGIEHLGRIGYARVAAEYRSAGIWAYPCSFRESSCISGLKAQAGGAVPAVIPTGALRETVLFGLRTAMSYDDLAEGESDRALVDEWREAVIELLRSPRRQQQIRDEMVPASLAAFAWSRVADAWEDEFARTRITL